MSTVDTANIITQDGVSIVSAVTDYHTQAPSSTNQGTNNQTHIGSAGSQFGRRRLNAISSGMRRTTDRSINAAHSSTRTNAIEQNKTGFAELDTHADTSCVGADCCILSVTDQVCQVLPYHQDYQPFDEVPIVQAATAYDDPNTGITYILIINQALQIPHLETTLLNPNQMRAHGLIVDDIPKHLLPNPTELSHSIYCPHEKVNTP